MIEDRRKVLVDRSGCMQRVRNVLYRVQDVVVQYIGLSQGELLLFSGV